jgi:dihydropyrimidinase
VGSDADIAIWDPKKKVTISQEVLHEDVDFTPYEGIEVVGWPVTVLSRGRTLVLDGEFVGETGGGEFLRCDRVNLNPPRGNRVSDS